MLLSPYAGITMLLSIVEGDPIHFTSSESLVNGDYVVIFAVTFVNLLVCTLSGGLQNTTDCASSVSCCVYSSCDLSR